MLTGCGGEDDDGEKGVNATISLAATSNTNEFTLTLTGATWKESVAVTNGSYGNALILYYALEWTV
jgi:hypothetical protein